jgi:hypothetical protein
MATAEKEKPQPAPKPPIYTPRGGATQFNDKKYDIKNYTYPIDLMSSTYGGNYVVFYINVASDSKLLKGANAAPTVELDQTEGRDRGDLIASGLSGDQLIGANAAVNTVAGLVGGSIAFKDAAGAVKGAVAANIPTVGLGIAAQLAPDASRSQKRLKTAIALHTPNQLSIRYGMQWSDEDTAMLSAAASGIEEIMKAVDSNGKSSDVKGVGSAIIANLALSKGPNAGANSAALGLAANPKKEQVFKGVDFRTFSFDYQFFPRNVSEARNILEIIQQFKYHMHPEFKDTNNFVYIYPSEFDIYYYAGTQENMNLHRHTSCVLTEMNVNYTPNGNFNTFENGMPTQINITLSFRELALLTKDKVKDGL